MKKFLTVLINKCYFFVMNSQNIEDRWSKSDLCFAFATGAMAAFPIGGALAQPIGLTTHKILEAADLNWTLQALVGFPTAAIILVGATTASSVAVGAAAGELFIGCARHRKKDKAVPRTNPNDARRSPFRHARSNRLSLEYPQ